MECQVTMGLLYSRPVQPHFDLSPQPQLSIRVAEARTYRYQLTRHESSVWAPIRTATSVIMFYDGHTRDKNDALTVAASARRTWANP